MLLISASARQRPLDLYEFKGQLVLHSEFKASQDSTVRSCLKHKAKQNKTTSYPHQKNPLFYSGGQNFFFYILLGGKKCSSWWILILSLGLSVISEGKKGSGTWLLPVSFPWSPLKGAEWPTSFLSLCPFCLLNPQSETIARTLYSVEL